MDSGRLVKRPENRSIDFGSGLFGTVPLRICVVFDSIRFSSVSLGSDLFQVCTAFRSVWVQVSSIQIDWILGRVSSGSLGISYSHSVESIT